MAHHMATVKKQAGGIKAKIKKATKKARMKK